MPQPHDLITKRIGVEAGQITIVQSLSQCFCQPALHNFDQRDLFLNSTIHLFNDAAATPPSCEGYRKFLNLADLYRC